jgi:hypothetical protein
LQDEDHWRDPQGANHRQRLMILLGDLACGAAGAPYVARQLVGRGFPDRPTLNRVAELGDQLDVVRRRMKAGREDPKNCPGVVGCSEEDWRALDAIKPD